MEFEVHMHHYFIDFKMQTDPNNAYMLYSVYSVWYEIRISMCRDSQASDSKSATTIV